MRFLCFVHKETRTRHAKGIINVSTLSLFLSFLPVSFSLFFSLPCLHKSHLLRARRTFTARRRNNDEERLFLLHILHGAFPRQKKRERRHGRGVRRGARGHHRAALLARLDISMFRFALSSKTSERVFGDNKDGTTNPNSIITKTSSSSSSSSMMMMVRE